MEQIVVAVPGMYADHHVLRVREALLGLAGVEEVTASAARRTVAVSFDETATKSAAIQEALASAGYLTELDLIAASHPDRHKDGSPWHTVLDRITTTERKDREMAGDFRRY